MGRGWVGVPRLLAVSPQRRRRSGAPQWRGHSSVSQRILFAAGPSISAENPGKAVKIAENPGKAANIAEKPEKAAKIAENPGKAAKNRRNPGKAAKIAENPAKAVKIAENPKMEKILHDFPENGMKMEKLENEKKLDSPGCIQTP